LKATRRAALHVHIPIDGHDCGTNSATIPLAKVTRPTTTRMVDAYVHADLGAGFADASTFGVRVR